MKDLIQCAAARDDFLAWLNCGNGALTIYSKENVVMMFKLEREPDADIQYLYHIAADKDSSISWNRNPVFCGVHDMKSQALYLTEHFAAFLLDGEFPLAAMTCPSMVKEICGSVNQRVEEHIGSDRNRLPAQELTGWQAVRDLQYYQEHGAKEEAIRRFFDGREPDGRFHSGYTLEELPETTFLAYIQDPGAFIQAEAERHIDANQEKFLLQFLKNDALMEEFQSLAQDAASPIHRMRAVTEVVKACGGKTVSVTIQKGGKELTFKTEARVLMGHRNAYSTFYITAADRRKFEEAFGRHTDYTAEDITRITYGRNTIYEASSVQMEDVGEEIKMGGNSEYVSTTGPEPDDGLTLGGMNWPTTL